MAVVVEFVVKTNCFNSAEIFLVVLREVAVLREQFGNNILIKLIARIVHSIYLLV